ncbi:LAQU0S16e02036g1_1 [Lachancea quebecensis]|uniref:LAQU0S16e02036g1_1 n=1 Tax=Lachancea quebecensis TaxID=1654605 RepID=A0A0P1KW94_9SACH|nr:LAQU0S16e02036g1_1 [Lachancea quebecensis]
MSGGLEPRTTARCTIVTSEGALKVELWAKEFPKTTRRFLENCTKGLYNGVPFDKKPNGLMIQTGEIGCDPVGAVESNTRVQFDRRGLLASFPSSKGSFFITLRDNLSLERKATVFGKLVDSTYYNVLSICDKQLKADSDEFLYPAWIKEISVEEPYFRDLPNWETSAPVTVRNAAKPERKRPATKRVRLVYEDEGDEQEDAVPNIKIRAAHDLLNDKRLVKSSPSLETSSSAEPRLSRKSSEHIGSSNIEHEASLSDAEKEGRSPEDTQPVPKAPVIATHEEAEEEHKLTQRERETLRLLEQFKKTSAKNKLFSSHQLNFGNQAPDPR